MRTSLTFGTLLLALVPMAVQASDLEVGLILDKEVGKAQAQTAAGGGLNAGGYDAVSPTGMGIRVAYNFLDLKVAALGADVTYHPKAQGDLVVNGSTVGKYGNEYVAVGVQADWKFLVNLYAGLDYRAEKLTTTVGAASDSTTQGRAWAKAGFGFSAPTPLVQPFLRLEVAAPLATSGKSYNPDDLRKAMAPSFQVALYGGIRF